MLNLWQNNDISYPEAWAKFKDLGGLPNHKSEGWQYSRLDKILSSDKKHDDQLNFPIMTLDTTTELDSFPSVKQAPSLTWRNPQNRAIYHSNSAYHGEVTAYEITSSDHPLIVINLHKEFEHIVINVADHVHVSFLVELSDHALSHHVIKINIGQNSHVTQYILGKHQGDSSALFHQEVTCADDSHYECKIIEFGGHLVRNGIDVMMQNRAIAHIEAVYLGSQQRHYDHAVAIYHDGQDNQSQQKLYSLLNGHAQGSFQGKSYVAPHAIGTDGQQLSRALMLSDDAIMNAKPELEIYADDVACSHAATIGKLDEEALFYCQSRGISKDTANFLLAQAFVMQILTMNDPLDSLLMELLESTLNQIMAQK
jgi:Fe-S cluster assembly scaffold protein SufB